MKYADNVPCKDCERCLEYAEAKKCRGCEAKTLQMFIRWMAVAFITTVVMFALALKAKADVVILTNEGFTVGFDTKRLQPVWASYDLEPSEVIRTNRTNYPFRTDPRTKVNDVAENYKAMSKTYDRGHLVPAADLNWSTNALKASYYFSNVCPMLSKLNRGKWLENEQEVRKLAEKGTVHVIVYPVYGEPPFPVIPPGNGFVFYPPEAFVKVAWGWFGVRTWVGKNLP